MRFYEVLFYDGNVEPPAYYLIDGVGGESPEEALRANLARLSRQVRSALHLGDDYPEHKIHEVLYVVRSGGMVSAREAT